MRFYNAKIWLIGLEGFYVEEYEDKSFDDISEILGSYSDTVVRFEMKLNGVTYQ